MDIAELVILRDVPSVSKRITIASGMTALPPSMTSRRHAFSTTVSADD